MKFGLVLLAAGKAKRFGESKLEANLNGKPIIEYILSSIPKRDFDEIVIVAANANLLRIAEKHGISGVINKRPEKSISESIKLGTQQVKDADAYVYCVCDQPLLSQKTIQAMLKAYKSNTILALSYKNRRGNPVIFPSNLYNELVSLKMGDSGQEVINKHIDILLHHETDDKYELMDIDTKNNFQKVLDIMNQKSL